MGIFEPTITVCSDASFRHDKQMGAWACYIRAEGVLIKTGGVIKQPVTDSTMAERYGLANALWLADKAVKLKDYRLIVYCDNIAAMGSVKPSNQTGAKKALAYQKLALYSKHIQRYMNRAKSCEIRHVKGHLKQADWHPVSKRNFMNDWCDKHAKQLLKAHIKEVSSAAT